MTLRISVQQSKITMALLKNKRVVDSRAFSYYHDISDLLTPLEVDAIKRKGFIKKGKTVIYGELLTGLITTLDKLLKRNRLDPIRHLRQNGAKRRIKAMSNRVDAKVLKSYKILDNLGKNSTSYKIAAAFIEGLKVGA